MGSSPAERVFEKAVSALQSEADSRDYLVTQMLLGLNVPEYRKSQDEKEFEDLSKTNLWYVNGLGCFSFSQGPFGNDVADGILSFQTSVEQPVRSENRI